EDHVVALNLASRRFRTLTARSKLSHGSPRYSPDGRYLALLTQNRRKSPVAPARIALIDRARPGLRILGARWDGGIHAPLAWTADSAALLFMAEEDARQHLFRFEIGRQAPEAIARGGFVSDFSASAGAIAFVRNTMSIPPAVFWTAGDGEKRIDRFNDDLVAGWRVGDVREFR